MTFAPGLPPAVVLAGGLGTRLKAVVPDLPKCMAPLNGRPFLEHLLVRLSAQGLTDFVLCVGYLASAVRLHFGDGARWGIRIRYAVEEELLGTGGAVGHAAPLLPAQFLVLNGDTYLECDCAELVKGHRSRPAESRGGSIAVARVADRGSFGSVRIDRDGLITGFVEKGATGPGWIGAGIYLFDSAILDFVPAGRPSSLEREVIPAALKAGLRFYAYRAKGTFVDIGTPEGYRSSQVIFSG